MVFGEYFSGIDGYVIGILLLAGFIAQQFELQGVVKSRNNNQLETMFVGLYTVFFILVGTGVIIAVLPFVHYLQGRNWLEVSLTLLYSLVLVFIILITTLLGISGVKNVRESRGATENYNHSNRGIVKRYRVYSLLILGLLVGMYTYFSVLSISGNHWRYSLEGVVFLFGILLTQLVYGVITNITIKACGKYEEEEREQREQNSKKQTKELNETKVSEADLRKVVIKKEQLKEEGQEKVTTSKGKDRERNKRVMKVIDKRTK